MRGYIAGQRTVATFLVNKLRYSAPSRIGVNQRVNNRSQIHLAANGVKVKVDDMTNKERYERAMRHDFPKDFLSDDEWDFIEAMASCRGDGVKNKSITAGRMPKSGGVKNMAKQTVQQDFSVTDKINHYSGRVNDPGLTEKQRKYAQKRLNELCGNNKRQSQPPKATNRPRLLTAQGYSPQIGITGDSATK